MELRDKVGDMKVETWLFQEEGKLRDNMAWSSALYIRYDF